MTSSRCEPERLLGNEGKNYADNNLTRIRVDDVNWKALWRNPLTGEYWKEFFPQSELHGGGPPEFVRITEEVAATEFGPLDSD